MAQSKQTGKGFLLCKLTSHPKPDGHTKQWAGWSLCLDFLINKKRIIVPPNEGVSRINYINM